MRPFEPPHASWPNPDAAGRSRQRRPDRRALAIAASLAVAAALPFLAAGLSRSFILFDDKLYLYGNPAVQDGMSTAGLRWAFTTFHTGNWHPLTWISHMLDISLFGLDAQMHHLVGVLLHALTTALIFTALNRMTAAPGRSAAAAALFCLHPLRVESVAWASERKDLLAGLFFALILLAYVRCLRRCGHGRCWLVSLLLAFGLMAKPMLVTVPFVLLLLDVWPLGRIRLPSAAGQKSAPAATIGRLVAEKLPLFALAAAASVITVIAQERSGAIKRVDVVAPAARLANALVSCVAYLEKTVLPLRLAVLYPHTLGLPPWWQTCGSALLLAVLSYLAWRFRRRHPHLAVGWLWFLGMLLPVSGLVQVGEQSLADRYTYLPHVGLFVAICWTAGDLLRDPRLPRVMPLLAAGAVLVPFAFVSTVQARRWESSETLFRHTIAVTAGNWLILNNLGLVLAGEGRFAEATARYREALSIRPGFAEARLNLANSLGSGGRRAEAVAELRVLIRSQPGMAMAHYNLANELADEGDLEAAVAHYREALRLQPAFPDCRDNLALALTRLQSRRAIGALSSEAGRAGQSLR